MPPKAQKIAKLGCRSLKHYRNFEKLHSPVRPGLQDLFSFAARSGHQHWITRWQSWRGRSTGGFWKKKFGAVYTDGSGRPPTA
jgi:hypothetical protein